MELNGNQWNETNGMKPMETQWKPMELNGNQWNSATSILNDRNEIQMHNHLVHKRTLKHLAKWTK